MFATLFCLIEFIGSRTLLRKRRCQWVVSCQLRGAASLGISQGRPLRLNRYVSYEIGNPQLFRDELKLQEVVCLVNMAVGCKQHHR